MKYYVPLNTKIKEDTGLTFDDVLLVPRYSDFIREEVDLSINLTPDIKLNLPVVSSPMDTVTMADTAILMAKMGGLGVVHRSLSIEDEAAEVKKVKNSSQIIAQSTVDKNGRLMVAAALGFGPDLETRSKALADAGVDIFVVDSGHGHSKGIIDVVKYLVATYDLPVMAGNIATKEAAQDLISAGASILRVGMGPGSICTTRVVTGMGVPQLTAINEVCKAAKKHEVSVIADGGIKQLGDIPKAIAFGAEAVMLGSMLAGFKQSPGQVVSVKDGEAVTVNNPENESGNLYKVYRGMGSEAAMIAGSAARYGQQSTSNKLVAEGVESLVPYKGDLEVMLIQIEGALRSSCYDTGCKSLAQMYSEVQVLRITQSSLKESHPHSVKITGGGKSYLG